MNVTHYFFKGRVPAKSRVKVNRYFIVKDLSKTCDFWAKLYISNIWSKLHMKCIYNLKIVLGVMNVTHIRVSSGMNVTQIDDERYSTVTNVTQQ